ncbi:MAG: hypothetical protein EOM51_07975 [Clostridia bacterium]|nr:hypothetical protein [Clostridia bacterium]
MKRNIGEACLCYCILKLTLFIIAMVTIFVSVLLLPPAILLCAALIPALCGVLYCLITDKSVIQKKE